MIPYPDWLPKTIDEAIAYYDDALESCKDESEASLTRQRLGCGDLFYLLSVALNRPDAVHDWLFDRCRQVQKNPNGYLDLWSREHYKSSIITFALTIMDILNEPDITIGIFSHTRPIAKGFLKQIKREFESNEELKRDHSDVLWANTNEAAMWSEEGIIVKRKSNPKEATIEAWGLTDGQPTSKHFKGRVYDDVVTRESVTNAEQVKKTTEAWELSNNLGMEGGFERYAGTRYDLADSYATMIKMGAVTVRKFAATHNGQMEGRPIFFTPETWADKKKKQTRKTIAAQLLQNPLASSEATFNINHLRPWEVRPRVCHIIITCDPSLGRHARNDNTTMIVTAYTTSGKRYLVDGYCHRMKLSEKWTNLKTLYRRWSREAGVQTVYVGYERYGAQTDIQHFELEMENNPNDQFPIKELNWANESGQSKEDRVARLEPDFRNANFYLPLPILYDGRPCTWRIDKDSESKTFGQVVYEEVTGLTSQQLRAVDAGSVDLIASVIKKKDGEGQMYDLTQKFIEEYLSFPFGEHDDILDAASRVYDMDVRPPMIVSKESTEPTTYTDS